MGAKMGSAKYCVELKMAEVRPRSEVGNQEATMRPLPGKTGDWKRPESTLKDEDRSEGGAGGKVAGKGGEKGADRPADDGDAVDAFGSEAVEQAAGRKLAERVGPTEREEQIAHPRGSQVHVLGHGGGGLRESRAVGKAEAAHHKENGDDEIANARLSSFRQTESI